MVVGEGQTSRRGLLRFVLEGDGCQVLAEAATSAELARELAVHRPDVIVLDDGIGATAVGMAKEMVPTAKVVLVWPRAVVPIGGDAQVDPGEVLSDLGPTVTRLAGAAALGLTTVSRPSWMDKNRKDTSTLRDMLNKADPERDRPSATELRRRGQRLHPAAPIPPIPVEPATTDAPAGEAEPVIQDRGTEPLVILPTTGGDAPTPTTTAEDETDDRSGAAAVAGVAGLSLAEQLAAGKAAEEAAARAAAEAAEPGTAEDGPVGAADGDEADSDAPERGGKVVPLGAAAAVAGAATVASVAGATPAAAAPVGETAGAAAGAGGATSQVAAGAAGAAGVAAKSKLLGSIALGGAAAAGALVLAISLGGSRVPTDIGAAPTEPPTGGSGGAVIWPGTDGTPGVGSDRGPGQGPGKGPDGGGPPDQDGGNEVPSDAFYPPVPSGGDDEGGVTAQASGAGESGTTTAAAGAAAAGGASGGGGRNDPAAPSAHPHPEHPLGGPPGLTGTAPGHGGDSPPGSQLQSTGAKGRGAGAHRGSRSGRGAERPAHHHKR